MRKTALLAACWVGALMPVGAADGPKEAAKHAKPLLVLVEKNPWLAVLGTDAPTFVLYEDGEVLFETKPVRRGLLRSQLENGDSQYSTVRLDEAARRAFVARALGETPSAFDSLEPSYRASHWTDEPTCTIHHWSAGTHRAVSVYGDLRRRTRLVAEDPDPPPRETAPASFVRAFDAIVGFKAEGAKPWSSESVVVMAWSFTWETDETPLAWPAGWPDLASPSARRIRDDYWWIPLGRDRLPRLQEILRGLVRRYGLIVQPVRISGKDWWLDYRDSFPEEGQWMPPPERNVLRDG
jgi:hypothetical protein